VTRPERREPQRTCVGCREKAGKRELVRVARAPDGRVSVDPTGRAPGRGAYVHRSKVCVARAAGGGGLARALKTPLAAGEAARLVASLKELGVGETT